jgi:hypothetical protein
MFFARFLPDWNSLDSVRRAHSHLELAAIMFFGLLAFFDVLSHLSEKKTTERVFEKIGLWFFVVAVAAESGGYIYGQRNDYLSEQVIVSLSDTARQASVNAHNALTDSGTALTKAGAAMGEAETATAKAATAGVSAKGALALAEKAKSLATKDEQEAARIALDLVRGGPRMFLLYDENQKSFLKVASLFPGQKVSVEYCSFDTPSISPALTDREAGKVALLITSLLQFSAKWNVLGMSGTREACLGEGVQVIHDPEATADTKRAAQALSNEFVKLALSGHFVQRDPNTRSARDTVTLFVMPHP